MIGAPLAALALLAGAPAVAAPEADAPVVRLETLQEGVRHLEGARSPVALVRRPGGGRDLVGLAGGGTPAEPRPAYLWRLRGDTVEVLRELPAADEVAGPLAADVDGDGRDDLVLFVPGRALLLRAGPEDRYAGALEPLVVDEEIGVRARDLEAPAGVTLDAGRLCTGVVGGLRCWSGTADAIPWKPSLDVPLPIALARGREGLRLTGMPVQRLPGPDLLLAAGFSVEGPERLRVMLIAPDAPEEARTTECWLRLPGPERVLEHAFLRLDGRPALAVTTIASGSLSLFGEKRMRLWLLQADRTRTGRPPLLAVTSSMNLWQAAHWFPRDVDGDGRDDLVLGYWKGLKDSRVVLESWLQKADGTFARGAIGAAFDVEEGNRSSLQWGPDATGDGRPDLLLLANGALEMHPGVPGKGLVAKAAGRRAPLREAGGTEVEIGVSAGQHETFPGMVPKDERIQPADLDGDGRPEWMVLPTDGHPGLSLIALPH